MASWVNHIEVLPIVRLHLADKIDPAGGIVIGKRPKQIRLDIVTLGLLTALKTENGEIIGMININSHHENMERIEELTIAIIDVMDRAYIDDYLFVFDKQYYFRLSRTLWMSNVRVEFTKELN